MSELRPGDAVFSHRELVATWSVIQCARELLRASTATTLNTLPQYVDGMRRAREAMREALAQLDRVVLEERAATAAQLEKERAAAEIDPEAPTEPARRG